MQTNKTPTLEEKQYLLSLINPEITCLDTSITNEKNAQINILLVTLTLVGMIIVAGITFDFSVEMIYLTALFFVVIWLACYTVLAVLSIVAIRKIKEEGLKKIQGKTIVGLVHLFKPPLAMFVISCALVLFFYPLVPSRNLSMLAYVFLLVSMVFFSISIILASKIFAKNKNLFEFVRFLCRPQKTFMVVLFPSALILFLSFLSSIVLLVGVKQLLLSSIKSLTLISFMELVIVGLSVKYYGGSVSIENAEKKKEQLTKLKNDIIFQNLSFSQLLSSYNNIAQKFI